MSQPDTNRNLLFAIMAVQMDFVPRDAMFTAMVAWTDRKDAPLGDLLVDRGKLSPARRDLLNSLLDEHIKAHAGDPARSLQAATSKADPTADFAQLSDPDVQASLAAIRDTSRVDALADQTLTHIKAEDDRQTSTFIPKGGASNHGRFRPLRPHAKGGLGIVSVALDGELDREVAFKEIQEHHADRPESRARFILEAEITGKLEHPGIVPVYGFGVDENGRPFYAMRFIRGQSLKDAIHHFHDPEGPYATPSKHALQLRELLGRFLDTCDALAYAHARGVIHRDLKPDNVMLGPFGETLVVDWGLAMATGRVPAGLETPFDLVRPTRVAADAIPDDRGVIVGTPAFMAPEQAEGDSDRIGVRSDVYGLGSTLYEILTGHRPITGSSREDVLKSVREGKITRPRKLRPEIPAALEAICLKALSHKAADRYPDPRALAADLKSWLADEPVTAHREPALDRARRWTRRNRVLVTGLAASLIVGLIGLATVAIVQTRARRDLTAANLVLDQQRRRAEDSEKEAIDAVNKFRDAVVNEPLLKNTPELEALRKRLLQEPLAFFKSLRERLQADNDTRPESLARLAAAAGALGHLIEEIADETGSLIAYHESRQIYLDLIGNYPNIAQYQRDLAHIAERIGSVLSHTDRTAEAFKSYEHARDILKALTTQYPAEIEYQSRLAGIYNKIGILLGDTGDYSESIKSYEQARDILKSLAKQYPAAIEHQSDLAGIYHNIGLSLRGKGQPADAIKAYEQSKGMMASLLKKYPSHESTQSDLALIYSNIAVLLKEIGDIPGSTKAHEQARDIRKALVEQYPAVIKHRSDLAASHQVIGLLLAETGEVADALKTCEQARDIRKALVEQYPAVTKHRSDLAASHEVIGLLLAETGEVAGASMALENARAVRQTLTKQNEDIPSALMTYQNSGLAEGLVLWSNGKFAGAMDTLEKARVICEAQVTRHPNIIRHQEALAECYSSIGVVQYAMRNNGASLKAHTRASEILKVLLTRNQKNTLNQFSLARTHHNIGILHQDAANFDAALNSHTQAKEIRNILATISPTSTLYQHDLASSYHSIGLVEISKGNPEDAIGSLRQAINLFELIAAKSPNIITYRKSLSRSYYAIGQQFQISRRNDEAIKEYEKAWNIERHLAENQPPNADEASSIGGLLNNLALIHLAENRFSKAKEGLLAAIDWQKKALATNPHHPRYLQFLKNHLRSLRTTCLRLDDRDGVAKAERELKVLSDSDPALKGLDARLAAVLKGEQRPRDMAERLQLSMRANDRSQYASAARLWEEALKAEPRLAEDREALIQYNAACAAALAGTGQGKDDPAPNDKQKAEFRNKARDWLRGELKAWEKVLDSGQAQGKERVGKTLLHWTNDGDLAGVREPAALAKLPEPERTEWETLWKEVERMRTKVKSEGKAH